MRHLVDHRKFGRTSSHRTACFKNLASALVRYERIETTLPKAKELRRIADRLVTWGKKGTMAARRQTRRLVHDRDLLKKIFEELAPRFASRNGGYTRILKTGFRNGDQAPLALIEYLDTPVETKKPKVKKAKKQEKAEEKAKAKKPK